MTELYEDPVIGAFQKRWYSHAEQSLMPAYWMGIRTIKCPMDMWVYQEILYDTKPSVIIETGTCYGGSALFLAHMLDLICGDADSSEVITIDPSPQGTEVPHPRITYVRGHSCHAHVIAEVKARIANGDRVMAILDSDHSMENVLNEMRTYGPMVTKGCYLIVEDGNVNGHPVRPDFGPGPLEAIRTFLAENAGWEVDRHRERFLATWNPSGYLKRIA